MEDATGLGTRAGAHRSTTGPHGGRHDAMEATMWTPPRGRRALALLVAAALLVWAGSGAAAVPGTLVVEGFIKSSGGGAVADGSYDLTLGLFGAKTGGTALWSDAFAKTSVTGGRFTVVLGSAKKLPPSLVAKQSQLWLSVRVGVSPELPRRQVLSKVWTLVAAMAEDLVCTNCVSVSTMKIDGDIKATGKTIKAAKVVAGDVTATTLTAKTFIGDGSKVTGVQVKPVTCPKGQAVGAVASDGKLVCVDMNVALPPDAIDELSNGLIHNQFNDVVSSQSAPVNIADNNPIGVYDTIDVPDIGIAQKLTVSINISNSDLKTVQVQLYDAANNLYSLWDKSGAGKKLVKTFPDPDKTLTGDLSKWTGKNPKGKWRLRVIDSAFLNNKADGAINSWSVNVQTLSNQKIQVKGHTLVTGDVKVSGSVKPGNSNAACTPALLGKLRFNGKEPQWCDGNSWASMGRSHQSTFRWQVWSTYGNNGWYGGNNSAVFGGIAPSTWSDSNGMAYQVSSKSEILRTFFNRAGPAIGTLKNANVYSEEWNYDNTSQNSRQVGALFRVRNKTNSNINWKIYWYRSARGNWSERASIAINGQNVWNSGGSNYSPSSASSHNITVPKNRTSTVIFIAASCPDGGYMRSVHMAFYNNCLALPNGLEFVDDLDTKPDGWDK